MVLVMDAAPARDTAYRAELGERVCMALMTRADWDTLLEIWFDQVDRGPVIANG